MSLVKITKSNHLVEASYSLTLQEQRLILSCLAKVDSRNEAPKEITLSAQEYEVVTNFATGTDEFNMDDMGLSNISGVQTIVADAFTQLATNDVVILSEAGGNFDGDAHTDDFYLIVDTAGDHSSVGIFKIDSATIAASDIDVV